MDLQRDKRFHSLTLEQVQTLDQVLTEVIPIHGRGNFPTLEVRPKDIIHVVKDRLVEREIRVRDIRLNGSTASHVMVRDNGIGYRDLDIIFGVELPRQEDFQVIKEVVLGSLRDLLPRGVNRRKITCLTMKEAYVQKMVKVFNDHDRWSLISLSNNRGKTVGLRFVSSLRRQFEFSVDSFQIILDRMLESYWETERKQQGGQCEGLALQMNPVSCQDKGEGKKEMETQKPITSHGLKEEEIKDNGTGLPCQNEEVTAPEKEPPHPMDVHASGKQDSQEVLDMESVGLDLGSLEDEEEVDEVEEDVHSEEDGVFELCGEAMDNKIHLIEDADYSSVTAAKSFVTEEREPSASLNPQISEKDLLISEGSKDNKASPIVLTEKSALREKDQSNKTLPSTVSKDSHFEHLFPPPAKKTCHSSQEIIPDYCPSPKPPRKMSRKMSSTSSLPEKWSLLKDLSDLTTQLFEPIEIPKTIQAKPFLDNGQNPYSNQSSCRPKTLEGKKPRSDPLLPVILPRDETIPPDTMEQIVRVKHIKTPLDSRAPEQESSLHPTAIEKNSQFTPTAQKLVSVNTGPGPGPSLGLGPAPAPISTPCAGPDPGPGPGPGLGSGLGLGRAPAPLSTAGTGPDPGPGPDRISGSGPEACSSARDKPTITVMAECMYGDFEQALDHLRLRLIATHNPEEIRGGGLLKYSDLLVRNFRPASETEIKSVERYMCSRFFIDFPDVSEQQRKIEAYLRCHFVGDEETSKYDYLMTLRRVIDESTVCLMGHERRQTLNMITVLALRVLGEQNVIPNTANVTCFYQPAPYMTDPIFSSYYIPQAQPPLLYHPYPLHVHMQTGLV